MNGQLNKGSALAPHDFRPTTTFEMLHRRAELVKAVRRFFEDRGFLEVETPVISSDVVVDLHIDPISVDNSSLARSGGPTWLQTSPEFCMKRLLAAGAEAIYQITRAFRAGERGKYHNSEFTMLEWYRVNDDYQDGMQLQGEVAQTIFERDVRRLSYRDAFFQAVGIDPLTGSLAQLRDAASELSLDVVSAASYDRDDWLNRLWVECVEPALPKNVAVIVYDWPASQAALARIRPEQPPVAERFELYVDGVELANGYHELTDPEELVRRNQDTNRRRLAAGKNPLPEEGRLIEAMRHGLPDCCGVALGLDRALMVLTGATHIDQVMPFPIERA